MDGVFGMYSGTAVHHATLPHVSKMYRRILMLLVEVESGFETAETCEAFDT
jgi:hypothetical protein